MAKYDREFLVPYLQNICALHILKRELDSNISSATYRQGRCERLLRERVEMPSYPSLYPATGEWGGCFIFLLVLLLIPSTIAFIGISTEGEWYGFLKGVFTLIAFLSIVLVGMIIKEILNAKTENNRLTNEYNQELKEAKEQQANNISYAKENLPIAEVEIQKWTTELQKTEDLLTQLYNVNVIPVQYRNIYTAVYLYEWFSTSMSDDLDHALSMFVLEEIKERLDSVIENQTQMILNQQLAMANQYHTQELLEQHSEQMMTKLDKIDASNEERNRYLGMIEGNTAAIAYFSAADYFSE